MSTSQNFRCYVSLPISGHEDDVLERSDKAKEELISMGYIPVSPLDVNSISEESLPDHLSRLAEYMGNDIREMLKCNYIYMCEGWENSKGCRSEKYMCEQFGIKTLYQNNK